MVLVRTLGGGGGGGGELAPVSEQPSGWRPSFLAEAEGLLH